MPPQQQQMQSNNIQLNQPSIQNQQQIQPIGSQNNFQQTNQNLKVSFVQTLLDFEFES